jgi:hypothetical protein
MCISWSDKFYDMAHTVFLVGMLLCFFLLVVFLQGCKDGCATEETRCDGSTVQVCNSSQNWEVEMDCAAIEPAALEWTCCVDPEDGVHSCLPADECGVEPDAGE